MKFGSLLLGFGFLTSLSFISCETLNAQSRFPMKLGKIQKAHKPNRITLDASQYKKKPIKSLNNHNDIMIYVDTIKKKHALKSAGAVTYSGRQTRDPKITREYRNKANSKAEQLVKKDARNKWIKDYVAKADVDHKIDRQIGGGDNKKNLQLLHRSVNRSLGKQLNVKGKKEQGPFVIDVK